MKIAHVTATFPPYRGGTGNVCYHNARMLVLRGHHVQVFTAAQPGSPPVETLDGIEVHRLNPLLRAGNASFLPQLAFAFQGCQIVHLHYPFLGGEAAALGARLRRIPLVITYHNDVLISGALQRIEKLMRLTIGRLALRSAARLLFTSADYGQASLIRPLLRGREERIGELPNGVDPVQFHPAPAPVELARRCRIEPGEQAALLVAGLDRAHYFKGVEVFLRALAALPAWIKGVIVGDGDLRPGYEQAAAGLGISGRVYFAGRVSDEELPDFYRLAAVSVLPSLTMGEAFGLVLVESMACATPVIASNLPGVRTVVAEGETGWLVPPGDASALAERIALPAGDAALRAEFGRRGRARVEQRYTWDKITDQLEQVYQEVLPTGS